MLVLTRKRDEEIMIGTDIVIRVIKTGKGRVRIGIEAPDSVKVVRGEAATLNAPGVLAGLADELRSDDETDVNDNFTDCPFFGFLSAGHASCDIDEHESLEECTLEALLVQN